MAPTVLWMPQGAKSASADAATAAPEDAAATAPVLADAATAATAATRDAASNAPATAPAQNPKQQLPGNPPPANDDLDAGPDVAPDAAARMDASQPDAATHATDAGNAPMTDAGRSAPTRPTGPAANGCTRERLLDDATQYLQALGSGDLHSLSLRPNVRYTENGQEETLGLGLWLSHPQTQFARHALDEASCGTATEAVLRDSSGRVVLGLRLRYVEQQLLEIEAQVVRSNDAYWAPDQIVVNGEDAWVEPLAEKDRSSAAELTRLAMNYFASTSDPSLLPPHTEDCQRRQNGALMPDHGSCGSAPGTLRFQQQRYPVVDETTGIVTALVKYSDYIGMYLFKFRAGKLADIEVVGGASSSTTGW